MKPMWIGALVLLAICASEVPALACTVTSTGEVPPAVPDERPDRIIVRPPFMGTGITMDVMSVVKGNVRATNIRAWSVMGGDCGGALGLQAVGSSIVIALEPVPIASAEARRTWGAAAAIPTADYFASSGCGNPVRVLSPEDLDQWIGRKLP
jgi:hypothetical protein